MDQRRGWCPSLWTPMESGDGLIVRLDVRARGLAPAELRALVELADFAGNGLIEITRRGRLQLRGVRTSALEPLQRALVERGLARKTVSRVVLQPWAGLHASCASLEALAHEIDRALEGMPLPDKFAVAVDAGDVLCAAGADLRADVRGDHAELRAAERLLGYCRAEDAARAVGALARAFTEASCGTRMRELVHARGLGALSRAFEPYACPPPSAAMAFEPPPLIGVYPEYLGLALPFGSGGAASWLPLADLAERWGARSIRITPFRSVIVQATGGALAARSAAAAGWIASPTDPLLRAIACPGAPACSSAHGEARALARDLARSLLPMLASDTQLHVSGCSKGCAHSGKAAITLVCDRDGARLGFDASAATAAASAAISLEAARKRMFALARTAGAGQARAERT